MDLIMNQEQIDEIMRLVSLYARKRVRQFAVHAKVAGPGETEANTARSRANAEDNLRAYLASLKELK